MILGLPWLKKHNPLVDWKNGTLTWQTNEFRTSLLEDYSLEGGNSNRNNYSNNETKRSRSNLLNTDTPTLGKKITAWIKKGCPEKEERSNYGKSGHGHKEITILAEEKRNGQLEIDPD